LKIDERATQDPPDKIIGGLILGLTVTLIAIGVARAVAWNTRYHDQLYVQFGLLGAAPGAALERADYVFNGPSVMGTFSRIADKTQVAHYYTERFRTLGYEAWQANSIEHGYDFNEGVFVAHLFFDESGGDTYTLDMSAPMPPLFGQTSHCSL